ncbi:type I restriction-modification enzyme R subunit C-terminal domain-containing protein [Micromonospora arborensis]|uniref:type I restriction-modification enzyme R subunit C-terminal domain-containing protein n=1 Tax=Micromonospora arborensis TaxID=2116518 RepID=UPI003435A428
MGSACSSALVGLDREAATEVFGDFLSSRTLNANQINFVNLIIAHLARTVMEPERLYDFPFSDIAPHGAGLDPPVLRYRPPDHDPSLGPRHRRSRDGGGLTARGGSSFILAESRS